MLKEGFSFLLALCYLVMVAQPKRLRSDQSRQYQQAFLHFLFEQEGPVLEALQGFLAFERQERFQNLKEIARPKGIPRRWNRTAGGTT